MLFDYQCVVATIVLLQVLDTTRRWGGGRCALGLLFNNC